MRHPTLGYRRVVVDAPPANAERVRAADVIGALSLGTDLAMGLPLEHGLQSALVAMRIGERLGVDHATAREVYYGSLLFYVGCTADAEVAAGLFEEDIHRHFTPARFGSRAEALRGVARAVAPPGIAPTRRAFHLARGLPSALRSTQAHLTAQCEVAQMLGERVGLPTDVRRLFGALNERWDGKGHPGKLAGEEIPLALRIVHVARDAVFQAMLGGGNYAAGVIGGRAGGAFDPEIAALIRESAAELLGLGEEGSIWDMVLAAEPAPHLPLEDDAIDRALGAMGDFADLASPYLAGHSSGVAKLAAAAAIHGRLPDAVLVTVRRAAQVHDLGRVAVPARIWHKRGALTHDDWEKVRLHPYYTERVLTPSPFLATLAPAASAHHERLDGSGYHRGVTGSALGAAARLLATADAYHAMTAPRPHRKALTASQATERLGQAANRGCLDPDAVAAVLEAAGQHVPRLDRPAGLTERETQVVSLLARGRQTKQIASDLGISVKTADRHIQNAYDKIGVSTRAAAALFAMEHGLVAWGELPIADAAAHR